MGFAWQMSMKFLSDLKVYDLRPNVTTYGAAVAACERGSTWPTALAILKQMEWDQCHPNTISIVPGSMPEAWWCEIIVFFFKATH